MNTENEKILKVVSEWMNRNGIKVVIDGYLWGDEYVEFFLEENDFEVLRLTKINVELHRERIYQVPLSSCEDFQQLIAILEPET